MGSNKSIRIAAVVAVVASGLAVGAHAGAATNYNYSSCAGSLHRIYQAATTLDP